MVNLKSTISGGIFSLEIIYKCVGVVTSGTYLHLEDKRTNDSKSSAILDKPTPPRIVLRMS